MDIWGSHSIEDSKVYKAQVGPLMLWLKKIKDEVHISVDRIHSRNTEIDTFEYIETEESRSGKLNWGRWIVGDNCKKLSLLPVMPDHSVVVRPEVPVKIPKDQEALFFVSIPVWVKVCVDSPEELVLCEESSILVSNIWFGDPMSGELCYSLRSRASRQMVDIKPKPHRVVCPVKIRNTTNIQLDVERFCVHVEYLNIYQGTTRLWTNEVNISFQGEDTASKITYVQQTPTYEETGDILSKARTPWKKTLFKMSLGTFKLITGF